MTAYHLTNPTTGRVLELEYEQGMLTAIRATPPPSDAERWGQTVYLVAEEKDMARLSDSMGYKLVRIQEACDFGTFWARYPEKKGKIASERAFERLGQAAKAEAIRAIPRYLRSLKPGVAMCYPASYLNGQRWLDV